MHESSEPSGPSRASDRLALAGVFLLVLGVYVLTSSGRIDTIASRQATCADVFVAAPRDVGGVGSVTYCAVDDGILARYFGADVSIELTAFAPTVDPARLTG